MVQKPTTSRPPHRSGERGQALVEYALILVLVVMAMVAAVAATGPALGNVFSNTVFNLIGVTGTPQDLYAMGGPTAFWQTVTAIATNPPDARIFPTSPPRPNTVTPTAGPSPTPTPVTPSATPTNTATLPPTPTATDAEFFLPHVDPIDQPVWWRVDNSVYLGGADWKGEYYPNQTLTEPADRVLFNQALDSQYRFNINFDWGNKSPIEGWLTDNFSIRYTRIIEIKDNPTALNFTLTSDDGSRLKINGTQVINLWSGGGTSTYSQTLSVGTHTLVVEYYEASGNASIKLDISGSKANVKDDLNKASGPVSCPWTRITSTQPNTISWAWKENSATVTNGFPQNMRCNLELRGFVDLGTVANPTMSFWDVWDFGTATDTNVKLQLAEYAPYVYTPNANPALPDTVSGGPNWTGGSSYTLHLSGKNYAWTRTELPIPAGLQGKKVTWRFVMESGAASSVRRWYVDDIRLAAGTTAKTFGVCSVNKYTCGSFWSLDVPDQAADFVTTGRWVLSNRTPAANDSGGPSLSWDVSNGNNASSSQYVRFGGEQGSTDYRIHYVALNGTVDLRSISITGSGGTPDWEGDSGYPILSFYHAFGLGQGDTIEVQYTRDTDTPGVVSNWQRVGTSPVASVTTTGTAITGIMKKLEIQLKDIPNWNVTPFRLRFALIVNNSSQNTGWFIDNIAIEREGVLRYSSYPFCDDAEGEEISENWLMSGQWGVATTTGAFNTGRSFSDSPNGNYVHGQATSMTLRFPIDFNNDSPENLTLYGGNRSCYDGTSTPAAVHPILSFWHWRKLAANDGFRIDLYRAPKPPSTSVIGPVAQWTYTYNALTATQVVWERQELDMRGAIEKATGLSWATLTTNADKYDDDFVIVFTLDALTNTAVSDGIYIDNIVIGEYTENSYKLWPTNRSYTAVTGAPVAGNGTGTNWIDNIDSPDDWYNRWTTGGKWGAITWDSHSGVTSLHDSNGSSSTKYLHQSYNVLEMNRILDLRGTNNTDIPTLFFWNHYNVGRGDEISVEIAVQDDTELTTSPTPRNLTGYDYRYQWGSATSYTNGKSWQSIWSKGANSRNDAWVREQVDLRNFVGKRLKVRFVLNAYSDSSNLGTGWWLDDIQFTFRTNEIFTVGFSDAAQNMRYWIPEGRWGLAPDQWRGSGGGPAELGSSPWTVWWFDCITWLRNAAQAGPNASYLNQDYCDENTWNTFFNYVTRTATGTDAWITPKTNLATNKLVSGLHYIKTFSDVVNYDFGSDGRPGTASDTWYDNFGVRMIRPITVTGGEYTFIMASDDGIRVRVQTEAGGVPAGFSSTFWNIVSNWTFHGRAVDYKSVTLQPGNYNIILEYFEGSGDAIVQMQVGTNKFSFSDSPKAGAGTSFPVVKSIPYSDSSLILNGVFNLNMPSGYTTAQWKPRLEYYTLYFFDSNSYGALEVSADGGFTWTQSGLTDSCPAGVDCSPNTWGYQNNTPANGGKWVLRSHNLSSYVNQNIGLRFRMHTDSTTQDGWWITDIVLGNSGT